MSSSFHHFIISFHNQSLRSFTAEGGGRHRGTLKRGLGTERARLGTFKGFGTEHATLGTSKKIVFLLIKRKNQHKTLIEKLKTVLPAVILNFFFGPPTSLNF